MHKTKQQMYAKMEYLSQCLSTNSKELKNFVMKNFCKSIQGKNWVERSTMLRNSTIVVTSNKKSTLELAFRGEQRFVLLN